MSQPSIVHRLESGGSMKSFLAWSDGVSVARNRHVFPNHKHRVLVTPWPEGASEDCPLPGERVRDVYRRCGVVVTQPYADKIGATWNVMMAGAAQLWEVRVPDLRRLPARRYVAEYPAESEAEARTKYGIPDGVTLKEVETENG